MPVPPGSGATVPQGSGYWDGNGVQENGPWDGIGMQEARRLAAAGADLAAEGRFEAASGLFRQALALGLQPKAAAAVQEMLAQCHMAEGRDEEACEAARAAVQLRPGWSAALLTLGRAARNAGRLREAAAALESCLQVAAAAAVAKPTAGLETDAAGLAAEPALPAGDVAIADTTVAGAPVAAQTESVEGGEGAGGGPADECDVAAARRELAEVLALLPLQLGHQLGLPGLLLLELRDGATGPGAVAWEAGALLAYLLVQQAQGRPGPSACSVLRGAHVLELGSGGTGLVGIAAACLGANVVATDLPEVLPQLQEAAALNAGMIEAGGGSLRCAALDWAAPDSAVLAPPGGRHAQYSWLVGADLVYSLPQVQPLVSTVAAAAAAAAAAGAPPLRLLIAHKRRHEEVDAALLGSLRDVGLAMVAVLRDAGSRCTVYANSEGAAALRTHACCTEA